MEDEENSVTMVDVLKEQEAIEEDAKAVLGASDDKNCTFNMGYIKRQALYACLTCCPDSIAEPSGRAGICLACSLACHENHDLIELYTKRNFRCDCGGPKFTTNSCTFGGKKNDPNSLNQYNQNFAGLYCVCSRPYPDPEAPDDDEMIQCIVCEDWLHSRHLNSKVPSSDSFSEMICESCMTKNDFLLDYLSLNIDNSMNNSIISNMDDSQINEQSRVENESMVTNENDDAAVNGVEIAEGEKGEKIVEEPNSEPIVDATSEIKDQCSVMTSDKTDTEMTTAESATNLDQETDNKMENIPDILATSESKNNNAAVATDDITMEESSEKSEIEINKVSTETDSLQPPLDDPNNETPVDDSVTEGVTCKDIAKVANVQETIDRDPNNETPVVDDSVTEGVTCKDIAEVANVVQETIDQSVFEDQEAKIDIRTDDGALENAVPTDEKNHVEESGDNLEAVVSETPVSVIPEDVDMEDTSDNTTVTCVDASAISESTNEASIQKDDNDVSMDEVSDDLITKLVDNELENVDCDKMAEENEAVVNNVDESIESSTVDAVVESENKETRDGGNVESTDDVPPPTDTNIQTINDVNLPDDANMQSVNESTVDDVEPTNDVILSDDANVESMNESNTEDDAHMQSTNDVNPPDDSNIESTNEHNAQDDGNMPSTNDVNPSDYTIVESSNDANPADMDKPENENIDDAPDKIDDKSTPAKSENEEDANIKTEEESDVKSEIKDGLPDTRVESENESISADINNESKVDIADEAAVTSGDVNVDVRSDEVNSDVISENKVTDSIADENSATTVSNDQRMPESNIEATDSMDCENKEPCSNDEAEKVDGSANFASNNDNENLNGDLPSTNNEPDQVSDAKKRKLDSEDDLASNQGEKIKKTKLENGTDKRETKKCIRPVRSEKIKHKGAAFWPCDWRAKLCSCDMCNDLYAQRNVSFLLDAEDTVSAYEDLGKIKSEKSTSQYEKGMEALSSLGHVQKINALTEYNKMKEKLLDFLKTFKDKREIVKEEDIKEFFAGMKPKREPDGVYFCR